MSEGDVVIELKSISLKRLEKRLFDRFSLTVASGERLVLVGASGVGKSTLLRLIAGLMVPDRGEIYIDGVLVTKDQELLIEPHKRMLNMVFQDLALWSHLSVAKNIAFALEIAKYPKEEILRRVKNTLAMVGLEGYEDRAIDTLSGGEQQRVALARALVSEPKILLMDEPLSHLDRSHRERLIQEIIILQEQLGFTLIYVTHDAHEIEKVATRLVTLSPI